MSLIPAKFDNVDAYLVRTHTDYINTWASVHDECDFTVPKFLRDAVMKKVSGIASLKDLLDKYKLPGISMSYDIEWDNYGSWTAGKSTDIYIYPKNREELKFYKLWVDSKSNQLKPNIVPEDDGKIVEVNMTDINKDWLDKLKSLPDGKDKVLMKSGENDFFEYERLVDYSKMT